MCCGVILSHNQFFSKRRKSLDDVKFVMSHKCDKKQKNLQKTGSFGVARVGFEPTTQGL